MEHARIPSPSEHVVHVESELHGELPTVLPPLPVEVTRSAPVQLAAAPAFTGATVAVPQSGSGGRVRLAGVEPTRRRLVVTNVGAAPVFLADTDAGAEMGYGYTLAAGASLVMLTTAAVYASGSGAASSCAVLNELAPW